MPKLWTMDDIPWGRFDATKLDPDIVKVAKAAAMVESNAVDYASYLSNVFPDDETFRKAAWDWADEEVQHGEALGRWAEMADPGFDYAESFRRFREGFKIPLDATSSVRGSRTGELIARCMVEVGTSSYYTALGEATEEPVLREICKRIATDEWRHYGLFYKHMKRYLDEEHLNKLQRLRVALSRIAESEDDELAYAYYAANADGAPYDRRTYNREYAQRAYALYRPKHVERAVSMVFKAVGFDPHGVASKTMTRGVSWVMGRRAKRLAAQGQAA